MKARIILSIAALCVAVVAYAGKDKKSRVENVNGFSAAYNYEVETVGVGSEGTKSLKVWAYDKTVEKAVALAKKCAVAACIYRGLPASTYSLATPALCENPDPKWDGWFKKFFDDGGQYNNYVNLTTDGMPSGQDRLKMKGGYKVGVYVQVLHDRLRKDLEREGIIKSMNSWF